jgi:hypothetical protein
MKGMISKPSTVTFTSLRGADILSTSSITVPPNPMIV